MLEKRIRLNVQTVLVIYSAYRCDRIMPFPKPNSLVTGWTTFRYFSVRKRPKHFSRIIRLFKLLNSPYSSDSRVLTGELDSVPLKPLKTNGGKLYVCVCVFYRFYFFFRSDSVPRRSYEDVLNKHRKRF